MRIKIIQTPAETSIDGIDLQRFTVGVEYEMGSQLATLFLAEGWAEPTADRHEAAPIVPFSATDPFDSRVLDDSKPPNLVREIYPPYYDGPPALAVDQRRRPRPRKRQP